LDDNNRKSGPQRRGVIATAAVLAAFAVGVYLTFILLQVRV